MAETEEERKAKEAEALFRIHGVDQRSSELTFTHPALADGAPIRLRQDGSDSNAFVPGTSTVIWPCAYTLGDFLCDATAAWRSNPDAASADPSDAAREGAVTDDTVVVELGAGLGLAGLVAAGLGAKRVAITDATPLAARRNLETAGFENASVHELWWRRAAWRRKGVAGAESSNAPGGEDAESESDVDEEAPEVPTAEAETAPLLGTLPGGRAPHLILGSDVCYSQGKQEMQMLVDTMAALAEPGRTTIYVVFEDRGDCCWGTLNHFWTAADAAGLEGDPTPVEDVLVGGKRREGPGRHNDGERLLLRLTKRAVNSGER